MVAQVKPAKAEKYPLGHAKENKAASAYTGFKYPEGGGKDTGVYKQPMENPAGTEKATVVKGGNTVESIKISLGSQIFKSQKDEVKSDGIKQRGHGAATKGFTSRGPMG